MKLTLKNLLKSVNEICTLLSDLESMTLWMICSSHTRLCCAVIGWICESQNLNFKFTCWLLMTGNQLYWTCTVFKKKKDKAKSQNYLLQLYPWYCYICLCLSVTLHYYIISYYIEHVYCRWIALSLWLKTAVDSMAELTHGAHVLDLSSMADVQFCH